MSRTGCAAAATLLAVGGFMSARAQAPVRFFPATEVEASFSRGGTLLETGNVRVMTAVRTEAGESERHARDTDIFHVLEGTAEFVTGGRITGGRETAPGEVRGTGIEQGESRTLGAGDVITIPAGVPHWFKSVEGRVRYFVVKVGQGG